MSMPSPVQVPSGAFLGEYARKGAFTDCYAATIPDTVTLAEYVEAFYTTRLFKLERWILSMALNMPSTDGQARQLAYAECKTFAAWKVERRSQTEILMDAGQTRSWLSVVPVPGSPESTTLLFGSAVIPRREGGKMGLAFHALIGFHRLYSKLLLAAARRRLMVLRREKSNGVRENPRN
jgi:hypothetical protein